MYKLPDDFRQAFTVVGQPIVQKNSKTIRLLPARNKRGSHRCPECGKWIHAVLTLSKAARDWRKWAVDALSRQWRHGPLPKHVRVNAQITSYMRTRKQPDASNLYQGPEDAMQEAEVFADDIVIASHNGSRRDYDPHKPRVEIVLTPAAQDQVQGSLL